MEQKQIVKVGSGTQSVCYIAVSSESKPPIYGQSGIPYEWGPTIETPDGNGPEQRNSLGNAIPSSAPNNDYRLNEGLFN